MFRAQSKFGSAFDQLADLTCFGIGPAIFFMRMQLDGLDAWGWVQFMSLLAGYVYVVSSVARIARELVVHNISRPTFFVGIPTNLACPVVVLSTYYYQQS